MSSATPSAKYDLTHTLSPFLDLHLMFPAMQFLVENKVYAAADLQRAQLELLKTTNMVDYEMELHAAVSGGAAPPAEMTAKRDALGARIPELEAACAPLRKLLQDDDEVLRLQEEGLFNPAALAESAHAITEANIAAYQALGKFHYDCGNYAGALEHLTPCCALFSTDAERVYHVLWGRLGAEILSRDWDAALESVTAVQKAIDEKPGSSELGKMQQRTWLLHWALYVFFNHPDGRDALVDFFFQQRMLEALQVNAPHLLRYFATAFVINKRRRNMLKDLVRAIQQLRHAYDDPVTQFLTCLYVDIDFQGAQEKLAECEAVLVSDFFLHSYRAEFMENARMFIFETYCRIHQKIDIVTLAAKLNMAEDEAERWIVDLVRNARLDAKIDSQNNHVIMGNTQRTVHQQVIEKTKDLATRTYVLTRCLQDQAAEKKAAAGGGRR
jgi:translation initiation factor 3 subunit E